MISKAVWEPPIKSFKYFKVFRNLQIFKRRGKNSYEENERFQIQVC